MEGVIEEDIASRYNSDNDGSAGSDEETSLSDMSTNSIFSERVPIRECVTPAPHFDRGMVFPENSPLSPMSTSPIPADTTESNMGKFLVQGGESAVLFSAASVHASVHRKAQIEDSIEEDDYSPRSSPTPVPIGDPGFDFHGFFSQQKSSKRPRKGLHGSHHSVVKTRSQAHLSPSKDLSAESACSTSNADSTLTGVASTADHHSHRVVKTHSQPHLPSSKNLTTESARSTSSADSTLTRVASTSSVNSTSTADHHRHRVVKTPSQPHLPPSKNLTGESARSPSSADSTASTSSVNSTSTAAQSQFILSFPTGFSALMLDRGKQDLLAKWVIECRDEDTGKSEKLEKSRFALVYAEEQISIPKISLDDWLASCENWIKCDEGWRALASLVHLNILLEQGSKLETDKSALRRYQMVVNQLETFTSTARQVLLS